VTRIQVSFRAYGGTVKELEDYADGELLRLLGPASRWAVDYDLAISPQIETDQGPIVSWQADVSASLRRGFGT